MSNLSQTLSKKIDTQTQFLKENKETPKNTIEKTLIAMEKEIARALPQHMTASQFSRVVLTAIKSNPSLLAIMEKNPVSMLSSIMLAAQLGLDLTPSLGQAYLIPYGDKCQFQIGYRGLLNLVMRSGEIQSIEANIVYDHDEFEFVISPTTPKFEHRPFLRGPRGKAYLVYCIARFKDGTNSIPDWMTICEIDEIRKRSKSSNSGPWVTDYEEMAKKTVIKRACKRLPISVEIMKQIEVDDTEKNKLAQDMISNGETSLIFDSTSGEVIEEVKNGKN